MEVIDDLEAEEEHIEGILAGLDRDHWLTESGAPGWTVADVVLHLAQSEEAVVASTGGRGGDAATSRWARDANSLDELMANAVAAERAEPEVVFERWRTARREALDRLRSADPDVALPWAAAPLRPRALATTRLAEHWAHALDITEPFGIDYPDTDRLRHVAWLAHRTLPYAFALAGSEAHEVFCALRGPGGDAWEYGPPDAASTISGPAGAFCRVGAQRLRAEASGLVVTGPHSADALAVLRNYAS